MAIGLHAAPPKAPETVTRIGALQAFRQNIDNSYPALGNPEHLPPRIAIAERHPTLVNSENPQSPSDGELPGLSSLTHHYLTFKSDGSTDLALLSGSGEEWHIRTDD